MSLYNKNLELTKLQLTHVIIHNKIGLSGGRYIC